MHLQSDQGNSNKQIVVAGGAGFVGSHLVERLLSQGKRITCVDDLSTGGLSNIEHLLANPNFSFVQHDICSSLELDVDLIFNLACPASPVKYQQDPIQTMKTSVQGALNLLELATKQNARIFQASTSEVYGDPLVSPQPESYVGNVNCTGPRACYDEGKRSAETLFFDFHRTLGTDIKVGRIFNTYGPRMQKHDGRVVSNFIVQALRNEPITIYGDGSQTRSFCYVDDLLDGIEKLVASPLQCIGPINLGSEYEMTMLELAALVLELTGSTSALTFLDLPADDPKVRRPDLTQAREHLNWEPKIKPATGLKHTIDYFDNLLSVEEHDSIAE